MAKQPFLPLFFGDFLASTAEWSGEEASLYLTLLGHQWTLGTLPADPAKLTRLVRWERKTFDRCWPQVSTKFVEHDGRLVNARLEQHRAKSDELAEKNRASGRKGAEARWRNDGERHSERHKSANSETLANANETLCHPSYPIPSQRDPVETSLPPVCVSANSAREKSHTRPEPEIDHHAEFEAAQANYPAFTGRQDWLTAEHHARRIVDLGRADWPTLRAAVERYAAFVAAGGASGPQYVLTPAKFFGSPDEPWAQPWNPPPTKADTRLAANLSAADEFLRRTDSAA